MNRNFQLPSRLNPSALLFASPMSEQKHLYLVDGSAYIFRAYYSLPALTNPEGVPVGAILGYTNMLWKLADDLHAADGPTHMAVILDKAGTSFRNEIYDQYKANRPPAPEDLRRAPFPCQWWRRRMSRRMI
jgi:5'-3' exonuclease